MAPDPRTKYGFLQDLFLVTAANVGVFYLIKYVLSRLETEEDKSRKQKAQQSTAHLQRLDRIADRRERENGQDPTKSGRPRKEELALNQYEQAIAMEVVAPEDIPVTFEDIGGLDEVIDELTESVIYPLTMPHLYSRQSSLLSAPPGVLLYGPPGCGKTMLAKALARESGATFINLHISTLTEKWFGDSNKLVSAVFSLARKLEPTIVFIDEIDAVLGQRRSGEHEASNMVKAEFMTHWDGLASSNTVGEPQRIMVLGATNRIQDIDEAILRRMPKKFPVSLPNALQRGRILALLLKDTKVDRSKFDLKLLVEATQGLSGSDLKEACRDAAMVPVREFIRQQRASGATMDSIKARDVRGLRTEDFFGAAGGNQILAKMMSTAAARQKKVSRRKSTGEASTKNEGEVEEIEEVSASE